MDTIRTIILEDHRPFRKTMRKLLERFEFIEVVDEAGSAEEGLEVVEEQDPDLAIVDIMLPGMDGFEFCRILRDRSSRVKVILMTMHGNFDYRDKADLLDIPYVHKQWVLEELPRILQELKERVSND